MLTFNFTRIFMARGINKPFSFLRKTGYSDNFATRIVNNRINKLNLKDIEILCEILQCTPNDLLEWTPDKKQETMKNHPLTPLKRTQTIPHLLQLLNTVPLNKLSEIETFINEKINPSITLP